MPRASAVITRREPPPTKSAGACVAWCVIYDYHAVWLRRLNFPPGKPIVMKSDAPFGTVSEQALGIFGAKTWEEALKTLEKFKLDGVAEKIECDLLVVHGSEDRQTPVEGAERLQPCREAGSKKVRRYGSGQPSRGRPRRT